MPARLGQLAIDKSRLDIERMGKGRVERECSHEIVGSYEDVVVSEWIAIAKWPTLRGAGAVNVLRC